MVIVIVLYIGMLLNIIGVGIGEVMDNGVNIVIWV
jgi:hypothetical protein